MINTYQPLSTTIWLNLINQPQHATREARPWWYPASGMGHWGFVTTSAPMPGRCSLVTEEQMQWNHIDVDFRYVHRHEDTNMDHIFLYELFICECIYFIFIDIQSCTHPGAFKSLIVHPTNKYVYLAGTSPWPPARGWCMTNHLL